MHVTKCGRCGKVVKKGDAKLSVSGEVLLNWSIDLCEKCAKPHVALLKKSELTKTENRA